MNNAENRKLQTSTNAQARGGWGVGVGGREEESQEEMPPKLKSNGWGRETCLKVRGLETAGNVKEHWKQLRGAQRPA